MIAAAAGSRHWVRARRRRRLGFGLIAFGIAGIVLIAAAAALLLGSLAAVDDAATGFERQRAELVSMIEPAATALGSAGDSAAHASDSLTRASDASRRAADLTNRLAGAFDSMAGLGSFQIFGASPFAGFTQQFTDSAAQARTLSVDLTSTADALTTNVDDSQRVAASLHDLADRLRSLVGSLLPAGAAGASSGLPIGLARLILLGLLIWFAIPAALSLWLGARLIRRHRIGPDSKG